MSISKIRQLIKNRQLRESQLNEAATMTVVVEFGSYDDLSNENKDRIEGAVLTLRELKTVKWARATLSYKTTKSPVDVITAWEYDGYNIDEFKSFSFR